jgi:hypothetical protein
MFSEKTGSCIRSRPSPGMCNGECGDHQLLRKPCVERRAIEWFAGHAPPDLGEISGGAWRPAVCAYARQGNCQFDKKTARAQRNSAERCVVWLSSQFAARLASRCGTTIELKLCSGWKTSSEADLYRSGRARIGCGERRGQAQVRHHQQKANTNGQPWQEGCQKKDKPLT